MKNLENGPERQAIIDRMLRIAREDAPWAWGYHPKDYTLAHQWVFNAKPNQIARNGLKYQRVDPALRAEKRRQWNEPVVWPIAILILVLIALAVPAVVGYRRRARMAARAPA